MFPPNKCRKQRHKAQITILIFQPQVNASLLHRSSPGRGQDLPIMTPTPPQLQPYRRQTIHTWGWEPLKAKGWILLPHCAQCLASAGHREKMLSEHCCMRCGPDHPPALAPSDRHSLVCMGDQSPPLSSRISAKLWSQNACVQMLFFLILCDPGLVT